MEEVIKKLEEILYRIEKLEEEMDYLNRNLLECDEIEYR